MTHWSDALREFAENQMMTPKVTGAIAGGTAALGTAGIMGLIHDLLSVGAIGAGVAATILLARYHITNERTARLKNKMLEKQLRDAGIDPDIE